MCSGATRLRRVIVCVHKRHRDYEEQRERRDWDPPQAPAAQTGALCLAATLARTVVEVGA